MLVRRVDVGGGVAALHTGGAQPELADGRAVLLVHGAGNDHTVWRFQTRRLAGLGVPAVAVDLPGHGRSDGPALASVPELAAWTRRLLDSLGVTEATLVGHSMGSLIALQAAAADPGRITRIALVATSTRMAVHPDLQAAADAQATLAADLIVGWSHTDRSRLGGHPQAGVWAPMWTRRLLERHIAVLGTDLRAVSGFDAAAAAAEVTAEALVVAGAADRMTPASAGTALASMLDAEVRVLPHGSHGCLYDDPEPLNEVLLPWLVGSARSG